MLKMVVYTVSGDKHYAKMTDAQVAQLRQVVATGDDITIISVEPYRRGMKVNLK